MNPSLSDCGPVAAPKLIVLFFWSMLLAACGGGADGSDAKLSSDAAPIGVKTALAVKNLVVLRSDAKLVPIVLNATGSARPGDVVSLQGENFTSNTRVYLESAPKSPLTIVNRVNNYWLAVQLPANAQGALTLLVSNGGEPGLPVKINAANPMHLDTVQLTAGGAFRVFGRNLQLPGSTPRLMIDGLAATVDSARSDEHMLTAVAPAGLRATTAAVVVVDNGNGSGAATLARNVEVLPAGGVDPFALGVGWAQAFAALAARPIDAATDTRLPDKVRCDGQQDDSRALQRAIELAASLGGGVVRLPAGRCRMTGGMELRSNVVVQGAGKTATELVYASNYPLFGINLDLAGIRNLSLTSNGSAGEGPLLKDSTRVFLQNVRVALATSRQMYFSGNRLMVVANSDFEQSGSISHQGPYTFNDCSGLVFEGNTTRWVDGAPAFGRIHDSYVHGNRFTRDASTQHAAGVVHSMTLDFAHRVAVVGNTFDVVNGPITNMARNDGEALLTEGGGATRTENLGTVKSATRNTLTDAANTLQVDPFGTGSIPENYGIAIVAGKGAGQTRRVLAYSRPTVTVERAWDVVPDSTSRYASFVWGLEKSLIKNNQFSQNPRGIWLYHTAIREVDVVGNSFSEGGGIYLRSFQNLASKTFIPIYNVLIAGNRVVNTTGRWGSYINSVFVNTDAQPFGMATVGVEIRSNEIVANLTNLSSPQEEYAGAEGYMNLMRVENYGGYESSTLPRMLGSVLANNSCTNCDVAVRVGTGAGGTTIFNTQAVNSRAVMSDSATTATSERSTFTLVR